MYGPAPHRILSVSTTLLLSVTTACLPAYCVDVSAPTAKITASARHNQELLALRLARPRDQAEPPASSQPKAESAPLTGAVSTTTAKGTVGAYSSNLPAPEQSGKRLSEPVLLDRRPLPQNQALVGACGQASLESMPITGNVAAYLGRQEQAIAVNCPMPDIHFWTNQVGIPQLDYRERIKFVGWRRPNRYPLPFNFYSGAVNNGDFRGFSVVANNAGGDLLTIVNNGNWLNLGPDIYPPLLAQERRAMIRDDSLARCGQSGAAGIQLSGSGILWGRPSERKHRHWWFLPAERMVTSEPLMHRSYLKGPVRLCADYIRLDGPISRIGSDVALTARHIVIDGIDLPPSSWRQALAQISQTAANPVRPEP